MLGSPRDPWIRRHKRSARCWVRVRFSSFGGEGLCCELGLAIETHCCEGNSAGTLLCFVNGGLGCDGVCVMLAVVGCRVCARDASIVVFGTMDLAVGIVWYCCAFTIYSITANWVTEVVALW